MLRLAEVLAPHLRVVRFNFPYREAGSKRPDPMPVLKDAIARVAQREKGNAKLLLGGRSMGGRAASMLAADGFACDGLLLFAVLFATFYFSRGLAYEDTEFDDDAYNDRVDRDGVFSDRLRKF